MIRRTLTAVAVAGGLLVGACGGETVYVTVEPTTTTTDAPVRTTTTQPASTRPPAIVDVPAVYDPSGYDTSIWAGARDFWWQFSTEELLNMGLIICQQFDQGRTIEQVAMDLVEILISNGLENMSDGVAAMTASALMYLCPEHEWWLDTI